MKFLAFADLHDDTAATAALVQRAQEDDIEFLVCAGDISQLGRGLTTTLKKLAKVNKPLYLVPGQPPHETNEMLETVLPKFPYCVNLHANAVEVGDYLFLGYGEGGFAKQDATFRKVARQWYGHHKGKKIVLVVHQPPFHTKLDFLDSASEKYVGNLDYRKFIERIKPKLVICGHIHESAGETDKVGTTTLMNPGWEGMVVELP